VTWMERNLDVQGYCLSKLATFWLLGVGLLFAFGQDTVALILGGILLGVCGLLTATNFCLPSTLLALWWRRRGTPAPTTQPS
jgi:Na+/proline symporter